VHLIPQGTPSLLIPLIVVIERVRNIIRPMTLAVRLSANIIAGHLLLSLLSGALSTGSFIVYPVLGAAVVALVGLECAVAVIQSYVFRVLLTLYSAEFSD
jgi:F-type H+-transporting ATPase subunit a